MQRKDFPEWLHCHPERALLESVVARINMRAKARVLTRVVKVPAHKGHPLNKAAADAAASQAALEADIGGVVSHSYSGAVRFYLSGRLTELGTNVRQHCRLPALAAKWGLTFVRCIVLDSHSIRIADEIVNLSRGCLGIILQFALKTGEPHFCHVSELGKTVSFTRSESKIAYPIFRTRKKSGLDHRLQKS